MSEYLNRPVRPTHPAPGTMLDAVLTAVETLGTATAHEVECALGNHYQLVAISTALGKLYLRRLLIRSRAQDTGTGAYRYTSRNNELTPAHGERLRDLTDPYLRAVE
ncbi:MAG: hypothetical protein Q8L45_01590 [Xanthomonadaceae bacterium]|nr:hypothetical protein [Xanthomonadaceae bacterium]MDP2185047.1 hypothetical protein [Xanthomonadales bacterium]MDZ4114426.1 hypothetical protein [Xanthomonadaceae bacterium]